MKDLPPLKPGSRRGAGYIYFMLAPAMPRPMVKIGFSLRSPQRRLKDCQTGSPAKLELIAWIVGAIMAEERGLHRRFSAFHSHGEWFFFEGELREYIEEIEV